MLCRKRCCVIVEAVKIYVLLQLPTTKEKQLKLLIFKIDFDLLHPDHDHVIRQFAVKNWCSYPNSTS